MTSARRLLERMARSSDPVLAAEAQKEIDKRDAAKRASRARTAPRRKAGAEKKRLSRGERNAKVAAIREAVFARAGGKCEVCRHWDAADAHHVLSGPDRRKYEATDTMLALCRECHGLLHRGEPGTLDTAQNACIVNGMVRATFALGKRIAKIEEARASSVRRAPEEV